MPNKSFWIGFLVAYLVAAFLPPSKLLSMFGKKSS